MSYFAPSHNPSIVALVKLCEFITKNVRILHCSLKKYSVRCILYLCQTENSCKNRTMTLNFGLLEQRAKIEMNLHHKWIYWYLIDAFCHVTENAFLHRDALYVHPYYFKTSPNSKSTHICAEITSFYCWPGWMPISKRTFTAALVTKRGNEWYVSIFAQPFSTLAECDNGIWK